MGSFLKKFTTGSGGAQIAFEALYFHWMMHDKVILVCHRGYQVDICHVSVWEIR